MDEERKSSKSLDRKSSKSLDRKSSKPVDRKSSKSKDRKSSKPLDQLVYPLEMLNTPEIQRLTTLNKLNANIASVSNDKNMFNIAHVDVKLACIKSLTDGIIKILEMCSQLVPSTQETEVILSGVTCIASLVRDCKAKYGLTIEDVGLKFFLNYFLELLYKNYIDSQNEDERLAFVSEVLEVLGIAEAFEFMLNEVIGAVKLCLNRINRTNRNSDSSGILEMDEIDILFTFFELMELLLGKALQLSTEQLIKLKSIERTCTVAIPYPMIGLYASKLATMGEIANRRMSSSEQSKAPSNGNRI